MPAPENLKFGILSVIARCIILIYNIGKNTPYLSYNYCYECMIYQLQTYNQVQTNDDSRSPLGVRNFCNLGSRRAADYDVTLIALTKCRHLVIKSFVGTRDERDI